MNIETLMLVVITAAFFAVSFALAAKIALEAVITWLAFREDPNLYEEEEEEDDDDIVS